MSGYQSDLFRWHCAERQSCYIDSRSDLTDLFDGTFPRRIMPTDIDMFVEINHHFLFMEHKDRGTHLQEGQRKALVALADLPSVTVLFFREGSGAADFEVLIFPDPNGWLPVSRDWFRQWLREWALMAEGGRVA